LTISLMNICAGYMLAVQLGYGPTDAMPMDQPPGTTIPGR
jgi:hypothetical protein